MIESAQTKDRIRRVLKHVFLIIMAFIMIVPFAWMILTALKTNQEAISVNPFYIFPHNGWHWENFGTVWKSYNFVVLYKNTLLMIFFRVLCAVLTATMAGYAFGRLKFRGKNILFALVLIQMMVPGQIFIIPQFLMVSKLGMLNTLYPLIIPSIAAPAVFYFMYSYMQSSLPMELVEAARIDGCGEFKIFNRIVLRIMKPAIAVQAIFVFVQNWNNYFIPALVLQDNNKRTLPILIAMLRSADFLKFDMGKVYMLITIAIVPIIIVYIALSRYIVAGVALGGVKE